MASNTDNTDSSDLARNLRAARERRGLTLTGLAERSGVAKSTLSGLESAAGNPTVATLWAIANALEVSFGELLGTVGATGFASTTEFEADGVAVRFIEQSESAPRLELYCVELKLGSLQESAPHPKGVRERVTVLGGALLVGPVQSPALVRAGQTHEFAADVPHVYRAVEAQTKAMVLIEYPSGHGLGDQAEIHVPWPTTDKGWDGLRSLVDRLLIEVSNGVGARAIRFFACGQAAQAAVSELCTRLPVLRDPTFCWPLFCFADADQQGPFLLLLPLRFTAADWAAEPVSSCSVTATLRSARTLSCQAQWPGLKLTMAQLTDARAAAAGRSWILGPLAAEVLLQRGALVLPGRLERVAKIVDQVHAGNESTSFSERIDVVGYDAFELIHPAYARQAVAVAEDIQRYAPDVGLNEVIDVGSGPGAPILMLHELLPDLHFVALEPDPMAFICLQRNICGLEAVRAQQTGFLEFDSKDNATPLITSTGASHHFNTAFMLQQAVRLLQPGGLLIVADEFIPEFDSAQARSLALLQHHAAYILWAMAWIEKCQEFTDLGRTGGAYFALRQALALALVDIESGHAVAAINRCREIFAQIKHAGLGQFDGSQIDAYINFFWLELQAMVAGFDYEVERKTHPRRFVELAALAGLELVRKRRIFATSGSDEWGGGTYVFTLRKPMFR